MKIKDGKAVPLTTEEKVKLAISYLCRDEGKKEFMAFWARDVHIESSTQMPMANGERINAAGRFVLAGRRLSGKHVNLPAKPYSFSIVIEDAKDEWGLPDIKILPGSSLYPEK